MKSLSLLILFFGTSLFMTNAQTDYCPPTPDVNNGGSGIERVRFGVGGIDKTSGPNDMYIKYTETTTVNAGSSVPFSINVVVGTFCPQLNIRVYIDFNRDYDFDDAGEEVFAENQKTSGEYTGNISIPSNANIGITRMRVMEKMVVDCGHTPINPCGIDTYYVYHGEIEDYDITIDVASGITENLNNQIDFRVYKSNSQIKVEYKLNKTSNVVLSVFDVLGQKLFSLSNENLNKGHHLFSIPTNELKNNSNLFIIQLNIDGMISTKKFISHK